MADITIYKPSTLTVQVLEGDPPADQSVLIAQLQADNATLQAKIDAARVAAQAAKDRDAANVEGQAVLDALA
jgi:hypothetical protein